MSPAALKSGNSIVAALKGQNVICIPTWRFNRMGQNLADGITQGVEQGDELWTAPLWGLGDRIFLLHDGRTKDLPDAIRQHDSQGSEAHGAVGNFQALTAAQGKICQISCDRFSWRYPCPAVAVRQQ